MKAAELFTTVNVPSIGFAIQGAETLAIREIDSHAQSAAGIEMLPPDAKRFAVAAESGNSVVEAAPARK